MALPRRCIFQEIFFRSFSNPGIFVVALVLSLFLANGTVHAEENGIFSGRVFDVNENPVPGVEVFVYTSSNTRKPADFISPPANANGEFEVTLPPGQYWTVARLRHGKERFGPLLPGDKHSGASLEIEVEPGDTVEEDFVVADLEETSKLAVKSDISFIKVQGYILSKQGKPVEDSYAYVNLSPARKKIPDFVSAWTDQSGRFILYLPEGIYYFASANEFPPGAELVDFQKVVIDSSIKNINIIREK